MVAPYDDKPWHEASEWLSAYECRHCDVRWVAPWRYPSGIPLLDHDYGLSIAAMVENAATVASISPPAWSSDEVRRSQVVAS